MATNPFCIDPAHGIFRAVKNGDNAQSPLNAANVFFDGFGPRYHSVFLAGIVTPSQLTPSGSGATITYSKTISLGLTLSSLPQFCIMTQDPNSGGWFVGVAGWGDASYDYQTGQSFGSLIYSFGQSTTTDFTIGFVSTVFSGSPQPQPPAISYRLFRI